MRLAVRNRILALERTLQIYKSVSAQLSSLGLEAAENKHLELEDVFVDEVTPEHRGVWAAWFLQIRIPDRMSDRGGDICFDFTLFFDRPHMSFAKVVFSGINDSWRLETNCSDQRIVDRLGLPCIGCSDRRIVAEDALRLIEKAARYCLSMHPTSFV